MYMAFSVHFLCNECSGLHPMRLVLPLEDGPPHRASIQATYAGKALPFLLTDLGVDRVICPKTGKLTSQKDKDKLFLVAIV
jgi:hypothetical protein